MNDIMTDYQFKTILKMVLDILKTSPAQSHKSMAGKYKKASKTLLEAITTVYIKKTTNPNMGRPTTAPKTRRLEIRLTESENDMLLECTEKTGKDRTAIIIEGITSIYKSL